MTILAVAAIFSVNVTAQNSITVRASVDSLAMFIGDQANVTFLVSQPAGAEVQMPLLSDTIASGLEIVDRSRMDTTVLEDGTFMKWLEMKGKVGGQHKVPKLSNDRAIVESILGIASKQALHE